MRTKKHYEKMLSENPANGDGNAVTINNRRPSNMTLLHTPLQITGSDTSVRITDSEGKTLATINRAFGDDDLAIAGLMVVAINEYYRRTENDTISTEHW